MQFLAVIDLSLLDSTSWLDSLRSGSILFRLFIPSFPVRSASAL